MAHRLFKAQKGEDRGEAFESEGAGSPSSSRRTAKGEREITNTSIYMFSFVKHIADARANTTQARQELKERAAENVRAVRAAMGLVNGALGPTLANSLGTDVAPDETGEDSSRSEAGPSKPSVAAIEEAEYSDEDQLATVTIIEDFDPSSSVFLPAQRASSSSPAPETAPKRPVVPDMPASSHKAQSKLRKEKEKERAKEAKHREKEENRRSRSMETKSERRKGREIEGKRRVLKATLAIERDGRRPRGVKAKGKGAGGKGKGGAGKKRK
jgi:ribosomal RNA-processing protein 17